jgi:cell division protein FtsB
MNMPVNRNKAQEKTNSTTNSIAVQEIKTNENESIITTSSIILSNKNDVKNDTEDISIPNEVKQIEEVNICETKNEEEPIVKETPKIRNPFEFPEEKKDISNSSTNAKTNSIKKNPPSLNKFINKNPSSLPLKPQININSKVVLPQAVTSSSQEKINNTLEPNSNVLSNNEIVKQEKQLVSNNDFFETQPVIDKPQAKINPFEKESPSQEEVRNLKSNLTHIEITEKKEEKEVKITSTPTSPKLDTRSCYTYTNAKVIHQTRESFSNLKEKYKNFSETKVSLETSLELANKKCEIYEKELLSLRKTLNEVKFQFSKTNEESFKLEITRLKQSLSTREKDNEVLVKENTALKLQLKKYEENLQNMMEENRKFRHETEKKIILYNKEIENFSRKSNAYGEERKEKEETENSNINNNFNYNTTYSNTNTYLPATQLNDHQINNFKRENKKRQNQQIENANNIVNVPHQETDNICEEQEVVDVPEEINTEDKITNNVNEPERNYDYVYDDYNDNYYNNNFTNGNPNIIEEVGSDNYLNMNGNTYDEMKDFKDDNLQDHQYFDNLNNAQNNNEQHSEYTFNNQKANTGDDFSTVNKNVNNIFSNNSKGESGATNTNIFSSKSLINLASEDNNVENENPFENLLKKDTTKSKETKTVKVPEKKNVSKVNSQTNSLNMVNTAKKTSKNILEENAFDIFEQSGKIILKF